MADIATDRIEKEIVMKAPRARVWRALTDAREFGRWFGVDLSGAFAPGETARGRFLHPGYEHLMLELTVERMEPERLFSLRWHPHAVDPARDYSQEPTTLVVFELQDVPGGTRVKVTESGFDQLPPARRAEAFPLNAEGWAQQVRNLAGHVESA
jgi:uncharacterized protein YndB with AHSA1/START domain